MSVTTETNDDPDETCVECDNCGYEWGYKGTRWTTTCPNCNRKTSTGLGPDD